MRVEDIRIVVRLMFKSVGYYVSYHIIQRLKKSKSSDTAIMPHISWAELTLLCTSTYSSKEWPAAAREQSNASQGKPNQFSSFLHIFTTSEHFQLLNSPNHLISLSLVLPSLAPIALAHSIGGSSL